MTCKRNTMLKLVEVIHQRQFIFFRQRNYVVRIGHRMTREQMKNHIPCKVYVWVNKPTKEIVEDVIKKYFK